MEMKKMIVKILNIIQLGILNWIFDTLYSRHLLSKGALARLTNSDGLTAEVI